MQSRTGKTTRGARSWTRPRLCRRVSSWTRTSRQSAATCPTSASTHGMGFGGSLVGAIRCRFWEKCIHAWYGLGRGRFGRRWGLVRVRSLTFPLANCSRTMTQERASQGRVGNTAVPAHWPPCAVGRHGRQGQGVPPVGPVPFRARVLHSTAASRCSVVQSGGGDARRMVCTITKGKMVDRNSASP